VLKMSEVENILQHSKNLQVLYVEDNKEARESTLGIFKQFFKDVIVAEDGEDGLDKFTSHKVDLVISDINMPKLNGLEMVEEIKKTQESIPVLILSAHNEMEYFIDSIKLGVDGYLLKPIDISQLLDVLSKVTSKLKFTQEAQQSASILQQYKEITDKSSIVSIIDTNAVITYVNDAFCELCEYSKDELIGNNYHNIVKYKQPDDIHKDIWNTIQIKKDIWHGVLKFISRNGKTHYLQTTIKPILDTDNNIIELIALRYDITHIMNPKTQLDDVLKSTKDPLLVYLKLEDYLVLEELYDNTTVEQIQDKISSCINAHLLEECIFNRCYQLGNGEYALVGSNKRYLEDKESFLSNIKAFQESIKDSTIEANSISYDISIMMSLALEGPQVLESAKLGIQELLKNKHDFIISSNFAQLKHEQAEKNMEVISMVKKAIETCKIVSYFQPIVNNQTKQIEKYESLVRLINEEGDVLSPYFFLDVCKRGKYYSQVTAIVLEHSFHALKHTDIDISINLSALDIEKDSTREVLFNLLDEHQDYTKNIVFELLEDESVKDFETIKIFIHDVKKMGVKIAIDDFGSGYSNFERLLHYQPDILKIDGALVKNIETNAYSRSVVKTIVAFAEEQNIKTVAEYVENEEIFIILKELGVNYSQGYYFGKPLPIEAL